MAVDAAAIEAAAQVIAQNMHVVTKIADRCKTYYTGQITPETIIHWLLQHRSPTDTAIAVELLDHVHFVDQPALAALLMSAYGQIPAQDRERAIVSAIGHAYDSGAVAGYGFSKALGLNESEEARRWRDSTSIFLPADVEASNATLVLLDDNITSGTQLERYFLEMQPDFAREREHFAAALSPEQLATRARTRIYVIVAVELAEGRAHIERFAQQHGLWIKILSGLHVPERCLEYGNSIWRDQPTADHAKELVASISRELLRDREWPEHVLNDRILGYGNLQKLVVFPHNVPKSLLPPFWKAPGCQRS